MPKTLPRAEDQPHPSHPDIPDPKGLAWHLDNLGAKGGPLSQLRTQGQWGPTLIDVPSWELGKTEASQEQSTLVEACSLWETELITHRKTAAGLELTRGFASQRKSVLPQGLADSALVILSKQDKHWANPLCGQSHQPATFFCWLTCFYRGKDKAVLARSQIPVFHRDRKACFHRGKCSRNLMASW